MTSLQKLNIGDEQIVKIDIEINELLSKCSPFKEDGYSEKVFKSFARFWLAIPLLQEKYDIQIENTIISNDVKAVIRHDNPSDSNIKPFAELALILNEGRSVWSMFCCQAYKNNYDDDLEEFKMEVMPNDVEYFVKGVFVTEKINSTKSIIDAFSI